MTWNIILGIRTKHDGHQKSYKSSIPPAELISKSVMAYDSYGEHLSE